MKKLLLFFSVAVILTSCENGEPLNMEADILSFSFKENIIDGVIVPTNEVIDIYIDEPRDLSSLTPVITVTAGATVEPASGTVQDFSGPVYYTVTSEDGNWQRRYKVTVYCPSEWSFDFENWHTVNNAYEHPLGWCSANAGVVTMNAMLPSGSRVEYPTYKTTSSYMGNYAAEVQTRLGGQAGYIPSIISGSLFLGSFNTMYALTSPLKCPQFGVTYTYDSSNPPTKLTGWIKYKRGSVFIDENGKVVTDGKDKCMFYARIFEGTEPLDGTNVQSSDRIIAEAVMNDSIFPESLYGANVFTYVEIPFTYKKDLSGISNLMITIVAASSASGDDYRGAPGSTLTVDNVAIK